MDTTKNEESVQPTSIIALPQNDVPPPVEDVNYIQNGGGPNRPYNNNYRPSQGDGNFNNYNGNRLHPNLSYSNNNFLQPPTGFNVSKRGVVEPLKKEDKYEQGILTILEVLGEDRKTNETKIGVVEARLNNLEAGLNSIASIVSIIKTKMDQVQKKAEEEKAKAAARVNEINKKWVAKKPKDEASTLGMKNEDCARDRWTQLSWPL